MDSETVFYNVVISSTDANGMANRVDLIRINWVCTVLQCSGLSVPSYNFLYQTLIYNIFGVIRISKMVSNHSWVIQVKMLFFFFFVCFLVVFCCCFFSNKKKKFKKSRSILKDGSRFLGMFWKRKLILYLNYTRLIYIFVVVLLFYVHGKHQRSCWDGQLT